MKAPSYTELSARNKRPELRMTNGDASQSAKRNVNVTGWKSAFRLSQVFRAPGTSDPTRGF